MLDAVWQPKCWIEFHILYISLVTCVSAAPFKCQSHTVKTEWGGATIWWTFLRPTLIFLMICAIWKREIMDHCSTWTCRGFLLCTTALTARCHRARIIMFRPRPAGRAAGRSTSLRPRVSVRTARASASCGPARSARGSRRPRTDARPPRSGRGGGSRRSTRPSTRWRGRPCPTPTSGYPRWRFYATPSATSSGCRSCCRPWTNRTRTDHPTALKAKSTP